MGSLYRSNEQHKGQQERQTPVIMAFFNLAGERKSVIIDGLNGVLMLFVFVWYQKR